jgi:hypothetical protein
MMVTGWGEGYGRSGRGCRWSAASSATARRPGCTGLHERVRTQDVRALHVHQLAQHVVHHALVLLQDAVHQAAQLLNLVRSEHGHAERH